LGLADGLSLDERSPVMDDETAAKYVLLDFELIALIALAMGVLVYAVAKRLRRDSYDALGAVDAMRDYDGFDLVLVLFPAMLFLVNPILEAIVAGKGVGARDDSVQPMEIGIFVILVTLGFYFIAGVLTYGLIEWVRNRRISDLFGLRRLRLWSIVLISLFGGIVSLFICGWLVGNFASDYLESLFGKLEVQEPVKMLLDSNSTVHFVLSVVIACVAAPLVEEFLFRGYFYGALRHLTHPVFAAVVVGVLFAVAHRNLPALLPLWAFSVLLCLAYELTRCLWVPVGMHVVFNAANIVLMMMPESEAS